MSGRIFNATVKCFEDNHWKYLWVEMAGETRLFMQVRMKNGGFLCTTSVREEKDEFVFSTYYGLEVPASKWQDVAGFLTRANDSLTRGNFELDRENGEVYFRTSGNGVGQLLNSSTIGQIVWRGLSTADRYLPGLRAVIAGDMPSDQATALIAGAVG